MDKTEKIKYWFEIALDDLDSARIMLEKRKFLQSGFYCHQSVEKALKGYFIYTKNEDPPYTHNLIKLSRESGIDELFDETGKNLINLLMPLNIEARYPDAKNAILKTLSSKKSEDIYNRTSDIIKWIEKLILL
jgi:HEPN domain-containing protein